MRMDPLSSLRDMKFAITRCVHCHVDLRYPSAAIFIQCPKCEKAINPTPGVAYAKCRGCQALLKYSSKLRVIQCPNCDTAMLTDPGPGADGPQRPVKRKRDPGAPRQASNSYMIFCKETRDKVKRERPDLPFGKIGAHMGVLWRKMTSADKEPFEAKAAKDRLRFKRENEDYYRRKKAMLAAASNAAGARGSPI